MLNKVEGFEVEVTLKDAIPHVRVSFADGRPALETNALSIRGMVRMGAVFTCAARMAYDQLDVYWLQRHEELRKQRADPK